MDKNSEDLAECDKCNWSGQKGELLCSWDENDNEIFFCPRCESNYVYVFKATKNQSKDKDQPQ